MSCHHAQLKILRSCFITRKIWYLEIMSKGPYRFSICGIYFSHLCLAVRFSVQAINPAKLNATVKGEIRKNISLLGSLMTTTQTTNLDCILAAEEHYHQFFICASGTSPCQLPSLTTYWGPVCYQGTETKSNDSWWHRAARSGSSETPVQSVILSYKLIWPNVYVYWCENSHLNEIDEMREIMNTSKVSTRTGLTADACCAGFRLPVISMSFVIEQILLTSWARCKSSFPRFLLLRRISISVSQISVLLWTCRLRWLWKICFLMNWSWLSSFFGKHSAQIEILIMDLCS